MFERVALKSALKLLPQLRVSCLSSRRSLEVDIHPCYLVSTGGLLSAMFGLVLFVDGLRVAIMPMGWVQLNIHLLFFMIFSTNEQCRAVCLFLVGLTC